MLNFSHKREIFFEFEIFVNFVWDQPKQTWGEKFLPGPKFHHNNTADSFVKKKSWSWINQQEDFI